MKTQEEIFKGKKIQGIPMIFLNLIVLIAVVLILVWSVNELEGSRLVIASVIDAVLLILNSIAWGGFMQIEPNEARVMLFFGKYEGTVKENGFFWVNPFYAKKKLTLRARNLDAAPIKVNDKAGNPVMIGLVLVWKVSDTYKASFDIDNTSEAPAVKTQSNNAVVDRLVQKMKAYENFVKVQSDAALRKVAGMYPYDIADGNNKDELTLRSGGEEINQILEKQLNDRLSIAGIEVVEARINYLAYAPEIAAVMLRRQQADAIIAAREKIVEGAVGMVKLALDKINDEGIVELDSDKKAAMVSNLLVVLCGEESTQPVVNAGTLYN